MDGTVCDFLHTCQRGVFKRCHEYPYTKHRIVKGLVANMKEIETSLLLDADIKKLMIHVDNVAFVQSENSLEHALLILIKSGYSSIPVLDTHSVVQGTVSKTLILDSILGLERIEFERLSSHRVEEVMNQKVPRVKLTDTFFRALELSINQPFISVEDEQGVFQGIMTRRAILALVYRYFREIHKQTHKA